LETLFEARGRNVEVGRKREQIADFGDTSRRRRFAGGMGGTAGSVGGNRLVRDEAVAGAAAGVAVAAARAVVPEERTGLFLSAFVVGYRWIGWPLEDCTSGGRVQRGKHGGRSWAVERRFRLSERSDETTCGLFSPKEQR
jgi:hypothetical protein